MFRATLKSVLARKLRLILSGLAVVLGVMFVSGAFVLTDTLSRSFDAMFASAYSNVDVNVAAKPKLDDVGSRTGPEPILAAVRDKIAKLPGVAKASGEIGVDGARIIGANGKVVTTMGAPRMGYNWTGESELVQLRSGRGPTADDEIAVNAALADAAKIKLGDRVGVLTLAPKREFTLVGIYGYSGDRDTLGGSTAVAFTEPMAQELMLGKRGVYSSVTVTAADGVTPTKLRDDLAAALGSKYEVKTGEQLADEQASEIQEGLKFFNNILLGFAGVALFVGIFLILNTFSIIIAQRTRELALLRAVGASRRQIIGSVLLEASVIGLVASALGLGAGVGVGALLAYVFAQMGGGVDLAGVVVPTAAVVSAFVVGIVVTLVAAVLPAVRASRIPPVAAMQDVANTDRPLTKLTVSGALIGSGGGVLLWYGLSGNADDNTLWSILAGVLVTFIGVALLTPLLSRPVVSLLGRLFSWSVPGTLGRLNSGRNPRRTAITAAALMVGIALITGVSVVLDSARSSLTELAKETVYADIFISGEGAGGRPATFDPAVLKASRELTGVGAAAGVYSDEAQIKVIPKTATDGKPLTERVWVGATDDLPAMRSMFGMKAEQGSIAQLRDNELVVDAKTAKELELSAGDSLEFQFARGKPHTFTVAAVYAESDVFGGFLLPASAAADFTIPQPVEAYLQLAPGASLDQVLPKVEALLADSPEVSAADLDDFLDQITGELDTLLNMIQLLLGLAILIAVLGIINTLALSVIERTRELGLLRAIGLRRGQTMRMITVEAVVISVFGALLGLVVGAGLGAAVVRALRSDGITELVMPWPRMGVYLALAAVVGVVAAAVPAIRAARLNVLGAIAHE